MAIETDANLGTATNGAAFPSLSTAAAAASSSRIILFLNWYADTGTVNGMTAGGGLTWVIEHQQKHPDNGWRVAILTADAPSGLASSTTLTPSFSAAPSEGCIAAQSFTGLATGASGYLTGTPAGSTGFDDNWTTANITTTDADAVILACHMGIASATQSYTVTSPATEIHDLGIAGDGKGTMVTAYRIVASTGTYSISGTSTVSVYMEGDTIAAIKAGAAEPPVENEPETLRVVRSNVRFR